MDTPAKKPKMAEISRKISRESRNLLRTDTRKYGPITSSENLLQKFHDDNCRKISHEMAETSCRDTPTYVNKVFPYIYSPCRK